MVRYATDMQSCRDARPHMILRMPTQTGGGLVRHIAMSGTSPAWWMG
jgi:hypothetical protein